jgi:hypothetical protein
LSILTKISIVVLVVLVLLSCAVFVTQATVAPNYRDLFEQEQARSELFKQQAATAEQGLALVKNERDVNLQAASDAKRDKETRIGELQAAASSLEVKYAGLQASNERLTAELGAQRAIVEDVNKRYDRLLAQSKADRKTINAKTEEASRLSSLLRDSRARVDRAERVARVYREQIVELEGKVAEMEQVIADNAKRGSATPGSPDGVQSPRDIEGSVLAFKGGIASVNVGSAKGVKVGMTLVVSRGPSFVGYMKVSEVDARHAAGIISDHRMDPQPGDKVTSAQAVATGG